MGTIFFSKLFDKELPNELLVIELLTNKLLVVELLTNEPLVLLELLEEKICKALSVQGVLLAKCCSSLDGYKNSLPHILHIRSLIDCLLASFFL